MSTILQQPPIFQQSPPQSWWRGLTRKQWLTLTIAYMGWVFDIMDMYLLVLVKDKVMGQLLGPGADAKEIAWFSGWALAITQIGWAVGGLLFGVVADRWGRSRTMALTILIYSIFTGLSGFAQSWQAFFALRFIAAMGIGGEWGTGASMLAEVFPVRARAVAAGILQSASGTGIFLATLIWGVAQRYYYEPDIWRYLFFIGAIPAFMALVVRMKVEEPEAWVAARSAAKKRAYDKPTLSEVFGDPELKRRTLLASTLAVIGIFCYWGTTFWAPEALNDALKPQNLPAAAFADKKFWGLMFMNVGVLAGFLVYIPITERIGRKKAFAVFHLGSLLAAPAAFLLSKDYNTWLALFFLTGLFTSGIYSGYTIYFPELYPTRVRATGASFCYNVGRVVSAPGPILKGWFLGIFGSGATAGAVIGAVYVLGFLVIPFLPETKGIKLDDSD